ncbi:MAG: protein kinase domain-containing protein [Isosphaeraceae bacterium]
MARLDHPNIVPIFEVGRFEDQQYFSMKLIGGESLDKRLKDYAADPRRAARLVAVAAGAIHHAHQRGILHRDLKPANILIDPDGQPHVTDFGLAKRVEGDSELTQSGAIVGTPAYMAPEQMSGTRGIVTTSTDVHGLGAILFALLTGRAPFGGAMVLDTLEQVRERAPDSPRKLNPRVPRDLDVICLKCLEKDSKRRYARADALAEDLNRWLGGEPIAARPVGSAARVWMWCCRKPWVAGAAGMIAAALVVVAVLSLLYASQQTRHASEQAEATRKISGLNVSLEKEQQGLKTSLRDSTRRLAMLQFERAQRAFDSGQVDHGLLWLVETWRYAHEAGDGDSQRLARTNLSLWRYQCPKLKGVLSHASQIRCVTFSRDGRTIVTGSDDGVARLWDAATAQPIGKPMRHSSSLSSVVFSPDGKTVLTASGDKTARLWDTSDGLPLRQPLKHEGAVTSVAYSPGGKACLTGSWDGTARLWDVATAQPISQPLGHATSVTSVAFIPDGKTFLTGSLFGPAQLWDATTLKPIGQPMERLYRWADSVAPFYSPDGKIIITMKGGTAWRWNATTGLPISQPLYPGKASSLTCSPDGAVPLTVSGSAARLWDANTSEPIGQPMAHRGNVSSVAFSPDGKTVLTGSHDNAARLWDVATAQPVGRSFRHESDVTLVAYSPGGKTVVTVSRDNTARLWDAAISEPVGEPLDDRRMVYFARYSADAKTILVGSFSPVTTRLWDAATLRLIGQPIHDNEYINAVALAPHGKTFLTAAGRCTARLWNSITGQLIGHPMWHQGRVTSVNYSPDGNTVATASDDKTARLWDTATTKAIGKPFVHEGAVRYVRFGPDGKTILTGSEDKMARLWDVASGRLIGRPLPHQSPVTWVAYSPNGKTLLTMSGDTARLWYAITGQPIGRTLNHQGLVRSLAFSPDGKTVLSGSTDNAARLWDATTGKPIGHRLEHEAAVTCVAYSPDGKTLVTGSEDKTARMWDATTTQPVGYPLQNRAEVTSVSYSPDGKSLLTGVAHQEARLWHLPVPVHDDLRRITAFVQTVTGLSVDHQGAIRPLDTVAWQEVHERLRQLGGPPKSDPGWLFDPILHGPDPTARARARMNQRRWSEAEAAFDEAVRARPFSGATWRERGKFYAARKRTDDAAADLVRAYALGDDRIYSGVRFNYLQYPVDQILDRALAQHSGGASGVSAEYLLYLTRP